MEQIQDLVLWTHRLVGYPTAFIAAPLALLAYARPGLHRRAGLVYVWLMVTLYLLGTFLTLTKHDWLTWGFARNLTFNFFGFSMVLYGLRAMVLFRREGPQAPERLDRFLKWLLTGSVIALLAVAIFKDTPMRVFTLLGIALVVLEFREVRTGPLPRPLLLRRHLRYILASYFYVFTVVSVVHLDDELARKVKWLWPSALALLIIPLATSDAMAFLGGSRARRIRTAVLATAIVALVLGAYVTWELVSGHQVTMQ